MLQAALRGIAVANGSRKLLIINELVVPDTRIRGVASAAHRRRAPGSEPIAADRRLRALLRGLMQVLADKDVVSREEIRAAAKAAGSE